MASNSQITAAATGAAAALGAYFLLAHTKCTASLLKCPYPPSQKKIPKDTEVKVYYYKATGLANQIRLALAAANIEFTDEYPTGGFPPSPEDKETWKKIGGNSTTNVPMLTIGDKVYTQSMAVMMVIARKADLLPKNDEEALHRTDKLLSDAQDFRTAAYKSFVNWGADQETADNFINNVVPLHFGNIERQLKEANSTFFCGETLTIADVSIYDALVNFGTSRLPFDVMGDYPALKAFVSMVEKNEGIAKYLKSEQFAGLMKFDKSSLGY